jgi:hypothetical protein
MQARGNPRGGIIKMKGKPGGENGLLEVEIEAGSARDSRPGRLARDVAGGDLADGNIGGCPVRAPVLELGGVARARA